MAIENKTNEPGKGPWILKISKHGKRVSLIGYEIREDGMRGYNLIKSGAPVGTYKEDYKFSDEVEAGVIAECLGHDRPNFEVEVVELSNG